MIGIIGASCCLPGGIETVQDFWEALCAGKNMAAPVPKSRWNSDRFYHPDSNAPGKTYMYQGHFVDRDLTQFDYDAFRISKREAEGLDPQQRLLLELTWQAMEDSGFALDALPTKKVGVYVGGFTLDHFLGQFSAENRSRIGVHTASGSTLTMLSNRISHTFDFQGPSLTIDTACSSSLVAYHYACEDLKKGLCDIAVVGGVNLMMRPEYPIGMAKGGFLAKDGRSKSFDARGDGYGRGEGGVVMVLRRIKDAELGCNRIWAVHVGSGVNQDGRTPGITLPSGEAQVTLMRDVLTRHNVAADAVAYVEAHGTGTAAGDPIEAASINEIYGDRQAGNICYIGSAKSNVGHLEAGSGLVGVLKAALIAKTRTIPPIAGFDQPNPKIALDDNKMALADKLRFIDASISHPMIAVNSFGYGGTNAHIVLQHYNPGYAEIAEKDAEHETDDLLLTLTAASQNALIKRVSQAQQMIQQHPERLSHVLKTFSRHASLNKERVCFVADGNIDMLAQINDFLDEPANQIETCNKVRKKIGFIYTGMGPQWFGMGQQLYRESDIYREAALGIDQRFQAIGGFSILQEMQKNEEQSRISETEFAQPANLLIQVALTHTLRAYGLEPHAITGHSVGDVAVAYIGGGLSLDDAIRVSICRSQLQGTLRNRGGMLAASIDEQSALKIIAQVGATDTALAAENSPNSITLAGPETELNAIAEILREQEVFHRLLAVEVPYHSKVMDEIHDALDERLADLTLQPLNKQCFSTVTGKEFHGPYDSAYWNRNVRQPVRFRQAVEAMIESGCEYFIEVGPHPVLSRSLQEIFSQYENSDCVTNYTLRRDTDEMNALRQCIKHAHCQSNGFNRRPLVASSRMQLPAYPWDKKEVWSESTQTLQDRCGAIVAPMLERVGEEPGVYITDLSLYHLNYLKSHIVDGSPVIPAAAVIEAALEAAHIAHPDSDTVRITQSKFMRTLALDDLGEQMLIRYDPKLGKLIVMGSVERGASSFKTEMAQMNIQSSTLALGESAGFECPVEDDIASLYAMFNDVGLHSDELFQTVVALKHDVQIQSLNADVEVNSELPCEGYVYHPTLLDGIFQSMAAFISDTSSAYIPISLDEMIVKRSSISPRKVKVNGRVKRRTRDSVCADLEVYCPQTNQVLIKINNLKVKRIKDIGDEQLIPTGNYQTVWQQLEAAEPLSTAGKRMLLIAADDQPLDQIIALLVEDGADIATHSLTLMQESSHWLVADAALVLDNQLAVAKRLSLQNYDSVVIWANLEERNATSAAEAICTLTQAMRSISSQRENGSPRLTIITENAASVTGSEILSPQAGAILGAQRVIWSEVEDVDVRLIDVDDARQIDPHFLLTELCNGQWCDEVALRDNVRFESLVRNQPSTLFNKTVNLSDGDAYRWISSGHNWLKEAVSDNNTLNEGIIAHISAYGDRGEFAQSEQVTPCLIVGHKEYASEYGVVETKVVTVSTMGSGIRVKNPPEEAPLVEIDDPNFTPPQLMQIALSAWGQLIVQLQRVSRYDQVFVTNGPLGQAIAHAARDCGANTIVINSVEECSAQLAAVEGHFSLMAVPVHDWCKYHDFTRLAVGGKIINLDLSRHDRLPPGVGLVSEELYRYKDDFESIFKKALNAFKTSVNIEMQPLGDLPNITSADIRDQAILDWRISPSGSSASASSNYSWDTDNWMLVTGGLGGIGEKYIDWLVEQGISRIVIAGRSAYSKISEHPVWQKLRSNGIQLEYVSTDITSAESINQLQEFEQQHGSITSVAHLAGIIDDCPLSDMTSDAFRRVIRVKSDGMNNILSALPAEQLHTVIAFSSIALVTGNSRQINYCAGNQYIENVSRNLRHQGVNSLVVHVGAIRDVGMIQRDKRLRQHIDNTGLSLISSGSLFIGIKHALLRGDHVVTAAGEPNWEKWSQLEVCAARSPRFREVLADVGTGSTDIYENLRRDLAQADVASQQAVMSELVRDAFAPVLRLQPENIPLNGEFSDLGIDSLMAAEVQVSLKKTLGMDVSILALISENQSVRKLADMELNKMGLGA